MIKFDGTFSDWLCLFFLAAVYILGKYLASRWAVKYPGAKRFTPLEIRALDKALQNWIDHGLAIEKPKNLENMAEYVRFLDRLKDKINA